MQQYLGNRYGILLLGLSLFTGAGCLRSLDSAANGGPAVDGSVGRPDGGDATPGPVPDACCADLLPEADLRSDPDLQREPDLMMVDTELAPEPDLTPVEDGSPATDLPATDLAPPVDGGCPADDACGPGAICQAGQCQPGCRTDEACPAGQICEALICQAGCRRDQQCQPTERCVELQCVPLACGPDGGCPAPLRCVAGQCVACENDGQCTMGQICNAAHECVAGCRSQRDCPDGQPCVDQRCRECDADDDCRSSPFEPNRICEDFTCREGCREDRQCFGRGGHCDPLRLVCVACLTDDDCEDRTPRCVLGRCEAICQQDQDCPSGFCQVEQGRCVQCRNDADCEGGLCEAETGRCRTCAADPECPAGYFCDVISDQCRPRVADPGLCGNCGYDQDCGGAGALCVINRSGWGNEVIERFCGAPCEAAAPDCPPGYECAAVGERGTNCIPARISNWINPTCHAYRQLGQPCERSGDCALGQEGYCVNGSCTVVCDLADDSCPVGWVCGEVENLPDFGVGLCRAGEE